MYVQYKVQANKNTWFQFKKSNGLGLFFQNGFHELWICVNEQAWIYVTILNK